MWRKIIDLREERSDQGGESRCEGKIKRRKDWYLSRENWLTTWG